LLLITLISCNDAVDYAKKKFKYASIKRKFSRSAKNCELQNKNNLHHCARWNYLTSEEFSETVMDGINRLNPPLKNSESFFELGVRTGAAIQVILRNRKNLSFSGSDFSEEAINVARKTFPENADNFVVQDMTKKHDKIKDNTYDHVFSFGALGMYLKKTDMIKAIREAVRITKPGGSLLFTHFVEPNGERVDSILYKVEISFWQKELPQYGVEDIKIEVMKHQGDRHQIFCRKK
jgi:ubiquinone/menaquinone biosynthesis C-methylase UbiE